MNIVSEVNLTSAVPVSTDKYDIIIKLCVILNAVCWENNVNVWDVKGKRRFKELVTARREYCYIACKLTQLSEQNSYGNSLTKIGIGVGIDYATVLHHKRKIEGWLDMGKYNLKEKLELIEGRLRF